MDAEPIRPATSSNITLPFEPTTLKPPYPLHILISTLFVLLILSVSSVIGGLGYKLSRDMQEVTAAGNPRHLILLCKGPAGTTGGASASGSELRINC